MAGGGVVLRSQEGDVPPAVVSQLRRPQDGRSCVGLRVRPGTDPSDLSQWLNGRYAGSHPASLRTAGIRSQPPLLQPCGVTHNERYAGPDPESASIPMTQRWIDHFSGSHARKRCAYHRIPTCEVDATVPSPSAYHDVIDQ